MPWIFTETVNQCRFNHAIHIRCLVVCRQHSSPSPSHFFLNFLRRLDMSRRLRQKYLLLKGQYTRCDRVSLAFTTSEPNELFTPHHTPTPFRFSTPTAGNALRNGAVAPAAAKVKDTQAAILGPANDLAAIILQCRHRLAVTGQRAHNLAVNPVVCVCVCVCVCVGGRRLRTNTSKKY